MSSVSVMGIDSLRGLYEDLKNDINSLLEDILEICKKEGLHGEDIHREIDSLRNLISKILGRHERVNKERIPSEAQYRKDVNHSFEEFKKQTLRVKQVIKEVLAKRQEILDRWKCIRNFTGFVEVRDLKEKIDNIEKLTKKDLDGLITGIEESAEFIELFNQVQEDFKRTPLPEGKGELHKEISTLLTEINKLKTSHVSPTQKINLMEEYVETIKTRVAILQSISSCVGSYDLKEYSMSEILNRTKGNKRKDIDPEEENTEKERNKIRKEIKKYLSKLKEIDKEEYENLFEEVKKYGESGQLVILRNLRDRVKMAYGEVKERNRLTQVYREEVKKILEDRDLERSEIWDWANQVLEKKYIEDKEFWSLFKEYKSRKEKIRESREKNKVLGKFLEILNSKGYSLVCGDKTIEEISLCGEVFELETPKKGDYKIQVKLDEEGHIITRFSKEMEEEELSDYEKQRDIEEAKKWCKDYKETVKQMKEEGFPVDIKAVKEPEEVGISYVKKRAAKRVRGEQKTIKQKEQERKLH